MGKVITRNLGYNGGGGGGGGGAGKEFAMKRGVKDYLSNASICLPTPYKMNSP